jgi:hypothetical protein
MAGSTAHPRSGLQGRTNKVPGQKIRCSPDPDAAASICGMASNGFTGPSRGTHMQVQIARLEKDQKTYITLLASSFRG